MYAKEHNTPIHKEFASKANIINVKTGIKKPIIRWYETIFLLISSCLLNSLKDGLISFTDMPVEWATSKIISGKPGVLKVVLSSGIPEDKA